MTSAALHAREDASMPPRECHGRPGLIVKAGIRKPPFVLPLPASLLIQRKNLDLAELDGMALSLEREIRRRASGCRSARPPVSGRPDRCRRAAASRTESRSPSATVRIMDKHNDMNISCKQHPSVSHGVAAAAMASNTSENAGRPQTHRMDRVTAGCKTLPRPLCRARAVDSLFTILAPFSQNVEFPTACCGPPNARPRPVA